MCLFVDYLLIVFHFAAVVHSLYYYAGGHGAVQPIIFFSLFCLLFVFVTLLLCIHLFAGGHGAVQHIPRHAGR